MKKIRFFLIFLLLFLSASLWAQQSVEEGGMDDNSFLMDQGFVQTKGTVEHIFYAITYPTPPRDTYFNFIQEWGIAERQDLGFTIPVILFENSGDGLSDIFLDYRYQIVKGKTSSYCTTLFPDSAYRKHFQKFRI